MPRPRKWRRICRMPKQNSFGPIGDRTINSQPIDMTIDEYETIRLIDLEGMTQEECAVRMGVARTTAQAIYISARMKLAECLVNEKELHIKGGDIVLCNGDITACGCTFCHKLKETGR